MPIFDAVVAGQVGGGLRRGDHVIGGNAVVEARTADVHQFAAELLQLGRCSQHGGLHLGIEPLGVEALTDQTHPQSLDGLLQGAAVIRHRIGEAGGIAPIGTGDHLQNFGAVGNAAAEGTHLIEGAGEGHQPPAAHPAIGGFEAHHTAEGGRLADRTAGIGAERSEAFASRHRRGTAAGATPRHPLGIPGITAGTKG